MLGIFPASPVRIDEFFGALLERQFRHIGALSGLPGGLARLYRVDALIDLLAHLAGRFTGFREPDCMDAAEAHFARAPLPRESKYPRLRARLADLQPETAAVA